MWERTLDEQITPDSWASIWKTKTKISNTVSCRPTAPRHAFNVCWGLKFIFNKNQFIIKKKTIKKKQLQLQSFIRAFSKHRGHYAVLESTSVIRGSLWSKHIGGCGWSSYYVYVKLSLHGLHWGNASEPVWTCLLDDFKRCVYKLCESQLMLAPTERQKSRTLGLWCGNGVHVETDVELMFRGGKPHTATDHRLITFLVYTASHFNRGSQSLMHWNFCFHGRL